MSEFRFSISKRRAAYDIEQLRNAVMDYVRYAPNADLGEASPRENIRSAFAVVRSRLKAGWVIQEAIGSLWQIAESMRDM